MASARHASMGSVSLGELPSWHYGASWLARQKVVVASPGFRSGPFPKPQVSTATQGFCGGWVPVPKIVKGCTSHLRFSGACLPGPLSMFGQLCRGPTKKRCAAVCRSIHTRTKQQRYFQGSVASPECCMNAGLQIEVSLEPSRPDSQHLLRASSIGTSKFPHVNIMCILSPRCIYTEAFTDTSIP